MAVVFDNLGSKAGLKKLDDYLLTRSYITGYQASKDDITVYSSLPEPPSGDYVNVSRWYNHIDALLRISGISGEGSDVTVKGFAPASEEAVATPPPADTKASAAEGDDDDDVDLFGEEIEEEKKVFEERDAAAKASGKKKESGKSSILLDVKPWDDETDTKKLEEAVEGLVLGADVIALSPRSLMATNTFVCEICNKGFQRDQNLQLHRRGHNLPRKPSQRTSVEVRKRVYICPEQSCVHHNPSRALGDLTEIKKHFRRKHGEKKWKCAKCSETYAVQSDWKAHQKTCTREYKCDCGTIFSRRDSFIIHRAFCDALAEENNKVNHGIRNTMSMAFPEFMSINPNSSMPFSPFDNIDPQNPRKSLPQDLVQMPSKPMNMVVHDLFTSTPSANTFGSPRGMPSTPSGLQLISNSQTSFNYLLDNKNGSPLSGLANMSATALLQKAAQMGATTTTTTSTNVTKSHQMIMQKNFVTSMAGPDQRPGPVLSYVHAYGNQQPGFLDGFNPRRYEKNSQDSSHSFDPSGTCMNDQMGLFGGMLTIEQNAAAFMKEIEQNDGDGSSGLTQARDPTKKSGGNDVTTVDFMGIGGSRGAAPASLHEGEQHQRHMMELEAMNQQRMQMMQDPFHHELSHQESAIIEKPL